jgi:hypothetical protein
MGAKSNVARGDTVNATTRGAETTMQRSGSSGLSRRAFLGSVGMAGTALVPLLDAERAHGADPPKRIILVMTPNGVMQDMYWPTGTETEWRFPDDKGTTLSITKPLTAVKDDLLVLKGIDLQTCKDDGQVGYGNAHDNFPHLLTATRTGSGKQAGGASLDQFLVERLNPTTKFKSLTLAVQVQWGAINQARISWAGAGRPVTPQEDPYKVFADVFSGALPAAPPEQKAQIERLFQAKRSVLDKVGRDVERFRARLGTEDRARLESHATAIRELERKFDPKFAVSATCAQPSTGSKVNVQSVPEYPRIGQLQMDMIVESMACDLTRIATLQWSNAAANHLVFSWLGKEFTDPAHKDGAGRGEFGSLHNHHELSHRANFYPHLKSRVEQWYHEQLLYLINKLRSKREGSGTMLDNTIILWGNNMHNGGAHSCGPHMPWLLAGRGGGAIRTGRFLDFGTRPIPHNRLLASLARAMGAQVDGFGDPKYAGTITELG